MNYFVDFEATQFSEEIISIGCVREDGETFYALVSPVDGKITPFITNLTGITAEMLKNALSPNVVFDSFYKWVFNNDDTPNFYVWGNSDVNFIRHTFKRTTSLNARLILGYMAGGISDFSKTFCKKIKASNCKLIKAYNCLVDDETVQNHNALDDAMMLYKVYQQFHELSTEMLQVAMGNVTTNNASKEKVTTWSHMGFPFGTICIINGKREATHVFNNVNEAAQWIISNVVSFKAYTGTIEALAAKVTKACNGKPYAGYKWVMVREEHNK